VAKMGLEKHKTSFSLMEVFIIALKCSLQNLRAFKCMLSPDMNPIEHLWDFIGRKINQHNPKYQNIDELRTAILQEWQQFPQERFGRLVRSMTRRVTELHNIYEVFIILKDVTMTWQKWGSKQALEKHKTSLFLMEVLTLH
jgi:hypothetical protein